MKELMMVSGIKMVDNEWMEITLTQMVLAKNRKIGLMSLATKDLDSLIEDIKPQTKYENRVYIRSSVWGEMQLKIGNNVSLELLNMMGGT